MSMECSVPSGYAKGVPASLGTALLGIYMLVGETINIAFFFYSEMDFKIKHTKDTTLLCFSNWKPRAAEIEVKNSFRTNLSIIRKHI